MLAKSVVSLVIASAGLIALPSIAADSPAHKARNLASACAMCHGTNGGVPSIAGRSREYLETQLRDFRAGRRPATIMQQIAKGYTDSELATLATHFAAQDSGNARVPGSAGKMP